MACLSKPVKPADLLASVELATRRHRQYRQAAADAAASRQALEDRKVIERAKGAVMKRLGLVEEEAYRRVQRVAS
jgi:response regulator NasT